MNKTNRIGVFLLLAALLLVPTRSAAARDIRLDDQVIFNQSFTLASGDVLDGDLIVLFGSATIEAGAQVNGSLIATKSTILIDGEVNGEVSVIGGELSLGPAAHVSGGISTLDAPLERAASARVDGQVNVANLQFDNAQDGRLPVVPLEDPPEIVRPQINLDFNPLLDGLGRSVGLALLAMLLMLFLAPHADRVARAAVSQPLVAGSLGLLTIILAPFAVFLLAITFILLPVAVVVALALMIAGVFGWIAIGYEVGQRFTRAIHQEWHPAFTAGLGTFALTLAAAVLTGIPVLNCIGFLVPTLLGLAALGAVIMTRFGTRSVLAPAPLAAPVPPQPVTPELPEPPLEAAGKKRGRKPS